MLLENEEYKNDVRAAARIKKLFWISRGSVVYDIIRGAFNEAVSVIVKKYRAAIVAEYGEHSDDDIFQSVKADVEAFKNHCE